jgi:phage tail-like protein
MPFTGTPKSFHKKFKFVVDIEGLGSAAFKSCSELSYEIAKVEYSEGGSLIPDKSPGRLTFADVTLERGATSDYDLYRWAVEVADASANAGLRDNMYKRTVEIVQLDRDGAELRRWRLSNAWVQKFVAGAWDNEADENVIESIVITYDFFEMV